MGPRINGGSKLVRRNVETPAQASIRASQRERRNIMICSVLTQEQIQAIHEASLWISGTGGSRDPASRSAAAIRRLRGASGLRKETGEDPRGPRHALRRAGRQAIHPLRPRPQAPGGLWAGEAQLQQVLPAKRCGWTTSASSGGTLAWPTWPPQPVSAMR